MVELSGARRPPRLVASLALSLLPPAARHVLRATPEGLAAAGRALELPLSLPACHAAVNTSRAALWLGPDERLLLGEDGSQDDTVRQVGQALAAEPYSLVDVSHRQLGLALNGRHATTLLATGCPLDTDPEAFPVGMCTRTVLAKAEIVLWRRAEDSFHIEVWRSFAAYVCAVIAEAARELTAD